MIEMDNEIRIINDFRSDAKIIFLALDDLILQLKTNDEEDKVEGIVHEMRVHFRKLISLIYFYRPLLREDAFKMLNRDFKILLRSFGHLRNQHVFDKHMQKYMESVGEESSLLSEIFARQDMESAVFSKEKDHLDPIAFRVIYENALKIMLGYGEDIFRRKEAEIQGLEETFILSRYSELMQDFAKLEKNLDYEDEKEVHAVRVAAKNIYYTLKSKEEKLGELAARRVDHLREIQNVAGRIHDADVHLKILEKFHVKEEEKAVFNLFLEEIRKNRSVKLKELKKTINSQPKQNQL